MAFSSSWFQQISLYKFRYLLGYGFVIVVLLFVTAADIGGTPSGLSQAEMTQAVTSTSLTFTFDFGWLINAPYNFIQKLSVESFGLSRLSLVIPSLIFGAATIIVFALTMKHWFRDTVAVVATVICTSSIPLISMLRGATPEIMLPFWTIILIYAAVRLLIKRDHAFHLKLFIVGASLGLLYTPYGPYPLLAIFGSALFHPHVRSRIRHIKRFRIIILSTVAVLGLVPLGIHLVSHPETIATMTGFDVMQGSVSHVRKNVSQLYDLYLSVHKNGFAGTQVIPLFSVATLALVILGVLSSIRDRHTARSYVLLSWSALTVLLALLLPGVVVLTFMPVVMLAAIGINTLVMEWYNLFPRNPYARTAGLIPLTILFVGIGLGNIGHYFNNYAHIPNTFYSQSLPAIQQSLVVEGNRAVILVAAPKDVAFYKILQKEHPLLTVTTSLPNNTETPTFVLPNSGKNFGVAPSRIITTSTKENSVALRVYRPQ